MRKSSPRIDVHPVGAAEGGDDQTGREARLADPRIDHVSVHLRCDVKHLKPLISATTASEVGVGA